MMVPEDLLRQGIHELGLRLTPDAPERLIQYVALLTKWNRVYNLTSVRKPKEMVTRHILDSLSVAPYLQGMRVLDVGTGAGLPGIPLAIACPERMFVLLDSSSKKLRFVRQVVSELGLNNATVENIRIEDYRPDTLFNTVVCRAFSALEDICKPARRVCQADGLLLAMKGVYPVAEMEGLSDASLVRDVIPLVVPGLDAERHLVMLRVPVSHREPVT
jgi:16S rRNA (guanine527-N7)-methyltransferase